MVQAIVIPVDLAEPARLDELDGLEAYQSLVDGDVARSDLNRPPAALYFNEEGEARKLPLNRGATVLWWAHNRLHRGQDAIAGPAFIVGPPDETGHDTDVPAELVSLLLHTPLYQYEVLVAGGRGWAGNSDRFSTWHSAYASGVGLALHSQVKEVRVVPAPDDLP